MGWTSRRRSRFGERAKLLRRAVLGLALVVGMGCGPSDVPSGITDGLEFYRRDRVAQAWPHFARAVVQQPKNADAHAWVAEADRRLGRFDEAVASARAALEIDPCHSFAHTVLGDAYSPRSSRNQLEPDSSWAHYRAAVACDPNDGNAWIGVWGEALRRGERSLEEESLRVLATSGFIPTAPMAFNRWVLRSVPDRALLITAGDWDTFPALSLQLVEGLRPDVGVVNVHMLNQDWYAELIPTRLGVEVHDGASGPEAILQAWRQAAVDRDLGRPLVFAVTGRGVFPREGPGALQEAGAFRRLVPVGTTPTDTAAMRRSLENVVAAELAGPETSVADRSAVRMAARHEFAAYVFRAALEYARTLAVAERVDDARSAIEWANTFAREAALDPRHLDALRQLEGELVSR